MGPETTSILPPRARYVIPSALIERTARGCGTSSWLTCVVAFKMLVDRFSGFVNGVRAKAIEPLTIAWLGGL
jgi:hypothetical protein